MATDLAEHEQTFAAIWARSIPAAVDYLDLVGLTVDAEMYTNHCVWLKMRRGKRGRPPVLVVPEIRKYPHYNYSISMDFGGPLLIDHDYAELLDQAPVRRLADPKRPFWNGFFAAFTLVVLAAGDSTKAVIEGASEELWSQIMEQEG